MMRRVIPLSFVLVAAALPAFAHPGHEASGLLHPFSGADHLLTMLGVGVWASFLARRTPSAAVLVPLAFLVMMGVGAAAEFAGINLPVVEAVASASVIATGALIVAGVRLGVLAAMAVVGLFALFHGAAHALEAPAEDTGGYILGFLAGTALLQAAGYAIGRMARQRLGEPAVRALGGVMAAAGAIALIAN